MDYHVDPFGNKIFIGTRLFVARFPRRDGNYRCEYPISEEEVWAACMRRRPA